MECPGVDMAKAPTGCDLNYENKVKSISLQESATNENVRLIDKNGNMIPKEKILSMIAYAKELHRKFPTMKENRLKRKVAEHFKIKLV